LFARKCLLVLFTLIAMATAQEITVAAAADTSFAMKEIAAKFEQERGAKVKISIGSSGNLFAQIQNGAPYDVFLSADEEYPQKLADAGLLEGSKRYAANALAILYKRDLGFKGGPGDVEELLRDPRVKRIAIANPQHAPFGRAAMKYVLKPALYEAVKDKIVLAENIAQTTQYSLSGSVDVAIVSRSVGEAPQVREQANIGVIPLPVDPPIMQAGGVVKASKQLELARQFFAYLSSPSATEILLRHGFTVPEPAK
jgi:molybdate transport system substrate-binding protein